MMTGSNSYSLLTILVSSLVWREQESTSETLPLSTSLTMMVSAPWRILHIESLSLSLSLSDLQINFGESDLTIVEGSNMLSTPIKLQFRAIQNPFTVTLSPVTIATAESKGLGFFINSMTITEPFRATAGITCFLD